MLSFKGYISEVVFNLQDADTGIYPYNLPVLKNLERLPLDEKVTYIVEENGSGKSTLIEAIALAFGFNAEGGSVNFLFSTRDSSSDLCRSIRLHKTFNRPKDGFFLRAESFYNVATNIEELDSIPAPSKRIIDSYGGKSLHDQSHGEAFLSLFLNRFRGGGLYILDEPESALSVDRQLTFLSRMHDLIKSGSQFIISTHSPVILSYPHSIIYQIGSDGLKRVMYEETEQYKSMKLFINNYRRILKDLLL